MLFWIKLNYWSNKWFLSWFQFNASGDLDSHLLLLTFYFNGSFSKRWQILFPVLYQMWFDRSGTRRSPTPWRSWTWWRRNVWRSGSSERTSTSSLSSSPRPSLTALWLLWSVSHSADNTTDTELEFVLFGSKPQKCRLSGFGSVKQAGWSEVLRAGVNNSRLTEHWNCWDYTCSFQLILCQTQKFTKVINQVFSLSVFCTFLSEENFAGVVVG